MANATDVLSASFLASLTPPQLPHRDRDAAAWPALLLLSSLRKLLGNFVVRLLLSLVLVFFDLGANE